MKSARVLLIAVVALLPLSAWAGDQGQITSILTRQSERAFAVRIVTVDGKNLPYGRTLIRLDAGKHRLGVVPLIERDNAFNLANRDRPQAQTIDIEVEAGKHYRIGAKVKDARYQDWSALIEYR